MQQYSTCSTNLKLNNSNYDLCSTWCIEINTTEIPNIKLIVRVWPNNAADAMPVNIVATVDEYFFNIVSARIIFPILVGCQQRHNECLCKLPTRQQKCDFDRNINLWNYVILVREKISTAEQLHQHIWRKKMKEFLGLHCLLSKT